MLVDAEHRAQIRKQGQVVPATRGRPNPRGRRQNLHFLEEARKIAATRCPGSVRKSRLDARHQSLGQIVFATLESG